VLLLSILLVSNPGYMKENFEVELLTWHKPDHGTTENVHELDAATWKKVEIINIDITSTVATNDYKKETDPL
jgi:hypothetical protein